MKRPGVRIPLPPPLRRHRVWDPVRGLAHHLRESVIAAPQEGVPFFFGRTREGLGNFFFSLARDQFGWNPNQLDILRHPDKLVPEIARHKTLPWESGGGVWQGGPSPTYPEVWLGCPGPDTPPLGGA